MQKIKSKILTVIILAAMTFALFPLSAVQASTGFIVVVPPTTVPAGGPITLDFTGVTWSGAQFYLYLSKDGLSQVSAGDVRFTPYFTLTELLGTTNITVTDTTGTYPGTWSLLNNVLSGTIPRNIAGGDYYIKAYDGLTTALAVTSPAFTVTGAFAVSPATGTAGRALTLQGNAFPANALINLTYSLGTPTVIQSLVPADAIGNLTYPYPAPDWKVAGAAGDNSPAPSNTITFTATVNATNTPYTAVYTETYRGIKQFGKVGTTVQNATGLYGNLTSFSTTRGVTGALTPVNVGVGDSLWMTGNYFYPGAATLKWDNGAVLANATVGATGTFNVTSGLTVPIAPVGLHNITIVDANSQVFVVFLDVVPSILLTPKTGPVGTSVTVNGYGFPATTTGNAVNATIAFNGVTAPYIASAITDSAGSFVATFVVPAAIGGAIPVTATNNATAASATATFTVTALFAVSPSSFANNASLLVTASGTGFKSTSVYMPNIDNQLLGLSPGGTFAGLLPQGDIYQTAIQPDATGTIKITFVGAGFSVGTHVITLYENGTTTPAAIAGFNVTSDPVGTSVLLDAINNTVTHLGNDTNSIITTVTAIQGSVAGLSGLSGQLTSIQNSIANIQIPNLGAITTSLAAIDAKLTTVSGDTATVKTSVGDLTTSLTSIGATVTSIKGDTATITTDLGTLKGTVTSINGNVATIQTSIGTLTTDISGLKTSVATVQSDVSSSKAATESLSPLVIVAIVLALIAAIAAIASIVLMRRKIAG